MEEDEATSLVRATTQGLQWPATSNMLIRRRSAGWCQASPSPLRAEESWKLVAAVTFMPDVFRQEHLLVAECWQRMLEPFAWHHGATGRAQLGRQTRKLAISRTEHRACLPQQSLLLHLSVRYRPPAASCATSGS